VDQSGIVITSDVGDIIAERAELWRTYDEAQQHFGKMDFKELDRLATEVLAAVPADLPPKLTDEGTPSSEVAAALHKFQEELARMAEARGDIANYRVEIKKVESQRLMVVIGAIFGILFLLFMMMS